MHNNFDLADAGADQAKTGLDHMIARKTDYDGLTREMEMVFTGAGGSENQVFQGNFRTAVEEFFAACHRLNGALRGTVGTQGSVQLADTSIAQGFSIV
jgi:hypothetical protein